MSSSSQYGYGSRDRRSNHPEFSELTVGDYASGMPSIRIGAMLGSMLRQLLWLIPLLLLGMGAIGYATRDIKRTYSGEGRVMVQLSEDYVYNPVDGSSSGGLMMTPDVITLNEIALMKNADVVDQVIADMVARFGESRFAKSSFKKINAAKAKGDKAALELAQIELRSAVDKAYSVSAQPKSYVIDLAFKHVDGEVAVATTNAFIDAYIEKRRTTFVDGSLQPILDSLEATEEQIDKNESNIRAFLRRHEIADFESELTGAITRAEGLQVEMNTLQAQMAETEAALHSVEMQLRSVPQTIDVYVDDRAGARVAQAELELKDLLSRYLPGSDPVRRKQQEIAQYKALQSASGGNPVGSRRVGQNPVFQELLTRRNLLQSTADSYREKEFALARQMRTTQDKVRKLTKLAPDYQAMVRKRTTLDQRHRGYTAKEQEALVKQQQALANSENVKEIARANLPRKGRNMRAIMFAVGTMGLGLGLFLIALLIVFLDPKLYTKPAVINGRRSSDPGNPYGGNGAPSPTGFQPPQGRNTSDRVDAVAGGHAGPVAYSGQQTPVFEKPYNHEAGAVPAQTVQQDRYTNPYDRPASPPSLGTLPSNEHS